MKVVLFCGGQGMRIREHAESTPKPLVNIGFRPIIWHVMKYYANYGHTDFILALGHRADAIKSHFLNYDECLSNDFILTNGGRDLKLLNSDIQDWSITFVDTGLHTSIGQRLKAVQPHLEGETEFLANYSDGLTDLDLPKFLDEFHKQDTIGSFLCVKPTQSFHVVSMKDGSLVNRIEPIGASGLWINGGYFAFKQEIFDYIKDGEDLVFEPFDRLCAKDQLAGYTFEGFWASMDTFKDKQMLEDIYARGEAPWEVWKKR